MRLVRTTEEQLFELMKWFSSEGDLKKWSGPGFRYPYTLASFVEDIKSDSIQSFSLVDEHQYLFAFGQYYRRLERCHLGRLVVNPQARGKGIIATLIKQLSEKGMKELQVSGCSLFVLADNHPAVRAYQKYGFTLADYPKPLMLDNCLYMIKQNTCDDC